MTGIYDLRHTRIENDLAVPVVSFPKCSKGVHGAFFSPISGKYALTTSMDHTLKIFNIKENATEAECKSIKQFFKRIRVNNLFCKLGATVIPHNNFTGRWLTPFKAMWHPQREDVFVVGSMEQPRRVRYLFLAIFAYRWSLIKVLICR